MGIVLGIGDGLEMSCIASKTEFQKLLLNIITKKGILFMFNRRYLREHRNRRLKELRDHSENIVIIFVGNKIRFTPFTLSFHSEDAKTFAGTHHVDNAFTEVCTQIHHFVSRKALDILNQPTSLFKDETVNVGSKDDVSAMTKVGCFST